MIIRKMTIDDYEQIYDLWVNTPGMGLSPIDDTKEGIIKYLERNPNTCFVADEEDKIVGVLMSGHDGRRGSFLHAAVAQSERRKGIGKELLDTAVLALRSEGITRVSLVAFANNEIGNAFWENQGYVEREDVTTRFKDISEL